MNEANNKFENITPVERPGTSTGFSDDNKVNFFERLWELMVNLFHRKPRDDADYTQISKSTEDLSTQPPRPTRVRKRSEVISIAPPVVTSRMVESDVPPVEEPPVVIPKKPSFRDELAAKLRIGPATTSRPLKGDGSANAESSAPTSPNSLYMEALSPTSTNASDPGARHRLAVGRQFNRRAPNAEIVLASSQPVVDSSCAAFFDSSVSVPDTARQGSTLPDVAESDTRSQAVAPKLKLPRPLLPPQGLPLQVTPDTDKSAVSSVHRLPQSSDAKADTKHFADHSTISTVKHGATLTSTDHLSNQPEEPHSSSPLPVSGTHPSNSDHASTEGLNGPRSSTLPKPLTNSDEASLPDALLSAKEPKETDENNLTATDATTTVERARRSPLVGGFALISDPSQLLKPRLRHVERKESQQPRDESPNLTSLSNRASLFGAVLNPVKTTSTPISLSSPDASTSKAKDRLSSECPSMSPSTATKHSAGPESPPESPSGHCDKSTTATTTTETSAGSGGDRRSKVLQIAKSFDSPS